MNNLRKIKQFIRDEKQAYWDSYYTRWPEFRESTWERSKRLRREDEERFQREWKRNDDFRHGNK